MAGAETASIRSAAINEAEIPRQLESVRHSANSANISADLASNSANQCQLAPFGTV
jgi:hypothetical protein